MRCSSKRKVNGAGSKFKRDMGLVYFVCTVLYCTVPQGWTDCTHVTVPCGVGVVTLLTYACMHACMDASSSVRSEYPSLISSYTDSTVTVS